MSQPNQCHAIVRWLLLVVVGWLVRTAASVIGRSELGLDIDAYARLAVNWSASGVFGHETAHGLVVPTAFRPPLYPWMLSWLVADGQLWIPAIAALHVILGGFTVGLTYAIGQRLRVKGSELAALAVAIDPILMRQSQLVMTETLATFLAALAWWLWLVVYHQSPRKSDRGLPIESQHPSRRLSQWLALIAFGIVMGLSILARPTAAPWLLICSLFMLRIGCSCWKRRINDVVLVGVVAAATLAPWILRNLQQLGSPIWATTHGGYTLLLANNPSLYQHFLRHGPSRDWDTSNFDRAWAGRHQVLREATWLSEDYWLSPPSVATASEPPNAASGDEPSDDRRAYHAAQATIARHPMLFLASCGYRTLWLWSPWPNFVQLSWTPLFIGFWYVAAYLCAAAGLRRMYLGGGLSGWLVGLTLVLSLTLVHAVFWSNMRMRAPATPCLMLLAVAALPWGPKN